MVMLMIAGISLGFGILDLLVFGLLDAKMTGTKKSAKSLAGIVPRDLTLGFFLTLWVVVNALIPKDKTAFQHYLSGEGYGAAQMKTVAVWCAALNIAVVGLSYLFRLLALRRREGAFRPAYDAVLNAASVCLAVLSCFAVFPLPSDVTSAMLPAKTYKMLRLCVCVAALVLTALCLVVREYLRSKRELKDHPNLAMTAKILSVVLVFFGCACIFGARFINKQWSAAPPEQLIINVFSPTTGTELGIYVTGFETGVIPALIFTVLWAFYALPRADFGLKGKKKTVPVFTNGVKSIIALTMSVLFFWEGFSYAYDRLHLEEMYLTYFVKSDFIEENFADAHTVNVTFPEKKRNLIFFYMESMENSYLSKELGGHSEVNLLPNLTELAGEGYVFSDNAT